MADRYRTQAEDTSVEVERLQFAIWARMSPARKLELVSGMMVMADDLGRAQLMSNHPAIDREELRLRVIARRLDRETMKRCYCWPHGE